MDLTLNDYHDNCRFSDVVLFDPISLKQNKKPLNNNLINDQILNYQLGGNSEAGMFNNKTMINLNSIFTHEYPKVLSQNQIESKDLFTNGLRLK